jgi:hypothetical protein
MPDRTIAWMTPPIVLPAALRTLRARRSSSSVAPARREGAWSSLPACGAGSAR